MGGQKTIVWMVSNDDSCYVDVGAWFVQVMSGWFGLV